jgi:hypothetical protein
MFELLAYDSFGTQMQPVSVKTKRLFKVVNGYRDHGEARLHVFSFPGQCRGL